METAAPGAEAGRLSRRRVVAGWAVALVGLPVLTAVLLAVGGGSNQLSLETMLFLSLAIAAALVGGRWPAVVSAVAAALLLNFYFIPPLRTLDIASGSDLCALLVFTATALAVATVVDSAARRREQAVAAEREAGLLAMLNRSVLGGEYDVPQLLALARDTFRADAAELVDDPPEDRAALAVPAGAGGWLMLEGATLDARERSVAGAFASHVGVLREREELARQSLAARQLEAGNRTRTALLAAVSHDLRTPLAGLRSAAETLRVHDQQLDPVERDELLEAMETSVARLTAMVSDLLDMSRLQTGAVTPIADDVPLGEVVGKALAGLDGAERVTVGELPTAYVDPGLLERVVANLVANALRHSDVVSVEGQESGRRVLLRVVDHGPGVAPEDRARMFEPFQRRGDVGTGVGLGLAVARGLAEALGGALEAATTPGGGLTMTVELPGPRR